MIIDLQDKPETLQLKEVAALETQGLDDRVAELPEQCQGYTTAAQYDGSDHTDDQGGIVLPRLFRCRHDRRCFHWFHWFLQMMTE